MEQRFLLILCISSFRAEGSELLRMFGDVGLCQLIKSLTTSDPREPYIAMSLYSIGVAQVL